MVQGRRDVSLFLETDVVFIQLAFNLCCRLALLAAHSSPLKARPTNPGIPTASLPLPYLSSVPHPHTHWRPESWTTGAGQ